MSDTVLAGIMNPKGIDVLSEYQKWANLDKTHADVGQTYAQTDLTKAQVPLTNAQTKKTIAEVGLVGAQTGQASALAGLSRAQTDQAVTANKLAQLNLAKTSYLYGLAGMLPGGGEGGGGADAGGGGGGGGGGAPGMVAGGSPGPVAGMPSGNPGHGPVMPGAAPPAGAPAAGAGDGGGAGGGGAPGAGGGGGGGAPGAGGGAAGAPAAAAPPGYLPPPAAAPGAPAGAPPGGAGGASFPGQLGMTRLGVPLPPLQAASVMMAADPNAALKTALEARRQAIFSTISGAAPGDYGAAMKSLYAAGFVTPQMMQDAIAHPEGRARILAATQSPEAYQSMLSTQLGMGIEPNPNTGDPQVSRVGVSAKGAVTGAESGARAQFETAEITIPDPDHPGQFRVETVLKSQLPQIMAAKPGAREASAADMSNPGVTIGPGAWVARVKSHENANGPPNVRNPDSTATGNGQFLKDTWKATVQAAKPAWAQGMNESQLLAARGVPAYSAQMTYALAQINAPQLGQMGVPVNSLTLGLAHGLGAAGAQKILAAPPGSMMRDVVSDDAVKANHWERTTVDQVIGQAYKKYGVNLVDLSKPYTEAAVGGVASSGPGGVGIPGVPVLTPQQKAGQEVTVQAIGSDQKVADAGVAAARGAQAAQTQLLQLRVLAPQISTGSYAETRQNMQNYLATFAPEFAQRFISTLSAGNIDPSKAGATQEFVKIALQQAGQAERSVLGSNGGVGAIELYQKAFPNIGMQPGAIKDMTNLLLVSHQRDVDYGEGANAYFAENRDRFRNDGGKYDSLRSFDKQFLKDNPPQVYVGAAAAVNQHPYAEWSKGLTPAQQTRALEVMWRADPGAAAYGPDGKLYHAPPAKTVP